MILFHAFISSSYPISLSTIISSFNYFLFFSSYVLRDQQACLYLSFSFDKECLQKFIRSKRECRNSKNVIFLVITAKVLSFILWHWHNCSCRMSYYTAFASSFHTCVVGNIRSSAVTFSFHLRWSSVCARLRSFTVASFRSVSLPS